MLIAGINVPVRCSFRTCLRFVGYSEKCKTKWLVRLQGGPIQCI
jgi:hypothetical protein